MGFLIDGLFVGCETAEYRNDDGSIDVRHIVNVATGRNAYPVYMKDTFDMTKVASLELGSSIVVSCRVYAGKNGRITCVDGELV